MVHDLLPVNEDRYQYNYVGNNDQQITKEVPTYMYSHKGVDTSKIRCQSSGARRSAAV
jgi:hypothetical protein